MYDLERAIRPGISENELLAIYWHRMLALGGEHCFTRLIVSGCKTNPWLQEAGSKLVLVDAEYTHAIDPIRAQLPSVSHFVCAAYDGARQAGWEDWDTIVAAESAVAPPAPASSPGRGAMWIGLVALGAVLVLGERPSWLEGLGIVITLGSFVGLSSPPASSSSEPATPMTPRSPGRRTTPSRSRG